MTSKQVEPVLSAYQKSVLTHMGILCWQSRTKTAAPASQSNSMTPDKMLPQEKLPSLEQKQANLAKLKQQISTNKITDSKQQVVLCMEGESGQSQLVTDVLVFIGVNSKECIFTTKPINQYKNYHFAWSIGESFDYQQGVLTTPNVDKLKSTEAKKQLWELLKQFANNQ